MVSMKRRGQYALSETASQLLGQEQIQDLTTKKKDFKSCCEMCYCSEKTAPIVAKGLETNLLNSLN